MKQFSCFIIPLLLCIVLSSCRAITRNSITRTAAFYYPLDRCTQFSSANNYGSFTYAPVTISKGTAPNEFIFNNFGGFDSPPVNVKAYITGKNTFVVPFQTQAHWGLSVKGQDNTTGTLNRKTNKITLPYIVLFKDNTSDTCTVELTRQ